MREPSKYSVFFFMSILFCLSLACSSSPGSVISESSIATRVAKTLAARVRLASPTNQADENAATITSTPTKEQPAPTSTKPVQTPTEVLPLVVPTIDNGYPPAPEEGCIYWVEIDGSYAGQTVCVYGNIEKSYSGDRNRFYMVFSPSSSSFRMILLGGYYMDLAKGQCVYKEGEILMYGKMPYMEIDDFIYLCE